MIILLQNLRRLITVMDIEHFSCLLGIEFFHPHETLQTTWQRTWNGLKTISFE